MYLIRFIINWGASMAWHLWRIATGRPYFRGMADTGFTVISFFLVFCAGESLRWAVVAAKPWTEVVTTGLITIVSILVIACRKCQSDSLVCSLMGTSAIVDLLACATTWLGLTDEPRGLGFIVVEVALYMRCIAMFAREDEQVRRRGYKRAGKTS